MEEKLVDEYIGEGAETFKTSKFNWVAAVLGQAIGPIWFFYRKAHLVGVLFIFFVGDGDAAEAAGCVDVDGVFAFFGGVFAFV